MNIIEDNLKIINDNISDICKGCGREIKDIKLIAVTKSVGLSDMQKCYNSGLRIFGESKPQELTEKCNSLSELNIEWHFIGHLQTNKVKYVVNNCDIIHSVDSEKLLLEIDKEAKKHNKIQKCFLEVKTSDEETKFGITDKHSIYSIIEKASLMNNIKITGLMTISPFTENEKLIINSFKSLRNLKEELEKDNSDITELSMGMTNDYKFAIEQGATYLRIGSAIFGERDYTKSWKEII